jgi:hypothetical protein
MTMPQSTFLVFNSLSQIILMQQNEKNGYTP